MSVLLSVAGLVLKKRITDLCVFARLEERSDADEADIVVPHDRILFCVARNYVSILEDYAIVSNILLHSICKGIRRFTLKSISAGIFPELFFVAAIRVFVAVFGNIATRHYLIILILGF